MTTEAPHSVLPRIRAHCEDGPRPCPWTCCRHHLRRRDHGERYDWHGGEETCALDLAARGGLTFEELGTLLGVTRERVRQIELLAVRHFRATCAAFGLRGADLLPPERPVSAWAAATAAPGSLSQAAQRAFCRARARRRQFHTVRGSAA